MRIIPLFSLVIVVSWWGLFVLTSAAAPPAVTTLRVPDGGVQPQVVTDGKTVHLIYLKGDPQRSDIFYIRSIDDGVTFSPPVRVNSGPGSAIAMGTVRGAHLALGRNGRLHVAWMGSGSAEPKAPGNASPMLYTRSTDDGGAFDPQRNLIQSKPGVDGGGSVAADDRGNVYIAWHAPAERGAGEQSRQVWLAQSADEGRNFFPERSISDTKTGACGCCGMRLFALRDGHLLALYRTANEMTHRDMTLIQFDPQTQISHSQTVGKMEAGICIMSTAAFAPAGKGAVAAWEISGQIEWTTITPDQADAPPTIAGPGKAGGRKHPAVATNAVGQTLLVWTEGTSWNRGGSIAWQIYDRSGQPIGPIAHAEKLPAWGAPAAFARSDGTFTIVY